MQLELKLKDGNNVHLMMYMEQFIFFELLLTNVGGMLVHENIRGINILLQ